MDNARIFKKNFYLTILKKKINVLYLPKYTNEFMPDELLFNTTKKKV